MSAAAPKTAHRLCPRRWRGALGYIDILVTLVFSDTVCVTLFLTTIETVTISPIGHPKCFIVLVVDFTEWLLGPIGTPPQHTPSGPSWAVRGCRDVTRHEQVCPPQVPLTGYTSGEEQSDSSQSLQGALTTLGEKDVEEGEEEQECCHCCHQVSHPVRHLKRWNGRKKDQLLNLSLIRSISQSLTLSVNQPVTHSHSLPVTDSLNQPVTHSHSGASASQSFTLFFLISQSLTLPLHQSVTHSQSASNSLCHSVSQSFTLSQLASHSFSFNQPVTHFVIQSAGYSISHSVSQSFNLSQSASHSFSKSISQNYMR